MRVLKWLVLSVALLAARSSFADTNVAVQAAAPEKDWSVTASADYFSTYLFRGVDITHSPVAVPSLVGTYKGLTAYYYGYYAEQNHGSGTYAENDYGADWTQSVFNDKLSLTGGAVGYTYLNGRSGTATWEVYASATWKDYLNPKLAINWDVDRIRGGYAQASISHQYDLSKLAGLPDGKLTLTPSAALGYDLGYNDRSTTKNAEFNDVLLGVLVSYNVNDHLSVHGGYQGSIALDAITDNGQSNVSVFNGGVTYLF